MVRRNIMVAYNDYMAVCQMYVGDRVSAVEKAATNDNIIGSIPQPDCQYGICMHNVMAYVTAR
jgi:hypothetical protein